MGHIAEFRVRSPEFALASALAAVPEIQLRLSREGVTDPARPSLLVWAKGDDIEQFESAIQDDDTVTDTERHLKLEKRALYQMRVEEDADVVSYPGWVEAGGEQLASYYVDGWWHNRMRLPEQEALSDIREWCASVGVEFELDGVYTDRREAVADLTDRQQESLEVAYEMGYFEIPRNASMSDLGERLDISEQAVSERLRRASETLVGHHFEAFDST